MTTPAAKRSSEFDARVGANQRSLAAKLRPSYDFIVCGSGSSGSVVARRLAESGEASVLLLEAGGTDDVESVRDPIQWHSNLTSERDWGFEALPNPRLNGRRLPLSMGKVLGGGSSINASGWARGHKHDWDHFAEEAGEQSWSYDAVLGVFRDIEDWQGAPDPLRRGKGGLVHVEPARDPNPLAPAVVEAAQPFGIPTFDDHNGRMMEGEAGGALFNLRIRDGRRQSVFRTYAYPFMDRPNLTVLTGALVMRVVVEGRRAAGVQFLYQGALHRITARCETVLSLGAINTPKVLMQSGIGDAETLARAGVTVVRHLPGVGRNFQDHILVPCVWEYRTPLPPRNSGGEATLFCKSDPSLAAPDLQALVAEFPFSTPEVAHFAPPPGSWSLLASLVRPASRGRLQITGPEPSDPIAIEAGAFADPADMKALLYAIELCREIGNSAAMSPFVKREVMPGPLTGGALETFARDAASTVHHQTCTAKMGRDEMSVVDGRLKVYGVDDLRIADGSILPRVTTGNTMAPCVIVAENAAAFIKREAGLQAELEEGDVQPAFSA
ncbi:MAG TPA: GMC family oxidoreductase N-terminal domain-containing protein [Caulobacteraceae bacterium]|nr:GMC family oxidoreductase N-terminal domain-containing protein [Caulobacteraceae bacterium]